MKKRLQILRSLGCMALLVALPVLTSVAAELKLVTAGKPEATIIIAKDALHQNRIAAEELQMFLEKMSGAKLPILTDETPAIAGNKILVGPSAYTAGMKLDIPEGFSFEEIKECYIVKRVGDCLVLVGNDGGPLLPGKFEPKRPHLLAGDTPFYKGTLFAVYDFLESLGCRWYFPGDFGQVVPEMKTVAVDNLDKRVKPFFLMHAYWQKPGYVNKEKNINSNLDHDSFYNRNRYISWSAGYGNANDGSIMGPIRSIGTNVFVDHPEYYGLNADKQTRNAHVLCMSNPEVVRICTEAALKHFEDNPDSLAYGLAPADGSPACYCDDCRKENGDITVEGQWSGKPIPCISGTYYKLMNQVAKEVGKKYPDKIISISIYAGRILPPPNDYRFEPNIGGHLALLEYTLMHPIDDPTNWQSAQIRSLFQSWKTRITKLAYRPYYPSFMVHCGLPIPLWQNTVKDVKFLARPENYPLGFKWEGWMSFNTGLIDYYLRSKLMWDPTLDGDALIAEFFSTFYGPAAEPVKQFYAALENAIVTAPINSHEEELLREIYNNAFIKSLMPLVTEAEKAVAGASADYQNRVSVFRMTAEHVLAYSEMRDVAERNYDFKRAAELAQRMTDLEDQILLVSPSFFFVTHRKYDEKASYGKYGMNFTASGKKTQYENLLKLTDGTEGKLIAPLPETWKLKLDSISEGLAAQWYAPEKDLADWTDVKIGRPLELQGHYTDKERLLPYLGEAWYAVDIDLSSKQTSKEMALLVGGINNEAWIWVNGVLAGYQPFHTWWMRPAYTWICDIPSEAVKPGKNRITIRVVAADRFGFGGIFRGMFLFEKMPESAANKDAATKK